MSRAGSGLAIKHFKLGETEIFRNQRRPSARPIAEYLKRYEDKREGMATAYATGDYSMKEIAVCFGVHYSTVSRAAKHFESQNA